MKLFGGVRGRGSATGRQRPAETHPSRAEEPEQPLLRSQVSQQPFEIDWESVWQREAAARQQAPSAGLSPPPGGSFRPAQGQKGETEKEEAPPGQMPGSSGPVGRALLCGRVFQHPFHRQVAGHLHRDRHGHDEPPMAGHLFHPPLCH